MNIRTLTFALVSAGLCFANASLHAAVSADEAKKLGSTLTPFGAEKAANKDGSIPEYTGGLTKAPASFKAGSNVRPDPFADEKPLFTIDAKNMAQYNDKLTEGAKALLKSAGFRMDVYPTHRTVAFPKNVLDNSVKNATRSSTSEDGLAIRGAKAGVPFPIPKNGNEVMHNYLMRYQGQMYELPKFSAYNVNSAGKFVLSTSGSFTWDSPYYADKPGEAGIRALAVYTAPARRAGEGSLVIDPTDMVAHERRAWSYLPGQRRVRLAPDLSYDAPNPTTSGMSTYDDSNLFSGAMDRFDMKLVGKKEIFVPYNTYRFNYFDKPDGALLAKFVNPDLVRWELHRVWVVEATLKEGKRHVYSRRTFYVDEDSWFILASDQYDGRGQLWRPGFAYIAPSYDALVSHAASGHYDLISGTYYISLWPGAAGVKFSDTLKADAFWTPDALAGRGVR